MVAIMISWGGEGKRTGFEPAPLSWLISASTLLEQLPEMMPRHATLLEVAAATSRQPRHPTFAFTALGGARSVAGPSERIDRLTNY